MQLLQAALQKAQAGVPVWILLQSSCVPVHTQLHEARVELTKHNQRRQLQDFSRSKLLIETWWERQICGALGPVPSVNTTVVTGSACLYLEVV